MPGEAGVLVAGAVEGPADGVFVEPFDVLDSAGDAPVAEQAVFAVAVGFTYADGGQAGLESGAFREVGVLYAGQGGADLEAFAEAVEGVQTVVLRKGVAGRTPGVVGVRP